MIKSTFIQKFISRFLFNLPLSLLGIISNIITVLSLGYYHHMFFQNKIFKWNRWANNIGLKFKVFIFKI